jgi:inner membrane protein
VDNLAHSLVGLASAKAGLERLSPYATTVCVVSANFADADFVTLFLGDRWSLLQHHRGITHSIIGTIAIGLLIPLVVVGLERLIVKVRRRPARSRLGGLMIASLIAAATHPILDWTNNYGVRPLLPWSGRWFYGDLVFIVDPYIWLLLGGVVFLLTCNTKLKTLGWSVLGLGITTFIGLAGWRSGPDGAALRIAFVAWIVGLSLLAILRVFGTPGLRSRAMAITALGLVVVYWGILAYAHHFAYANTLTVANQMASVSGERLIKVVAMPTAATPFLWQSVAETDLAMYRFRIEIGGDNRYDISSTAAVNRYEKPTGRTAQLASLAEQDRRAQVLLGFARFPIARINPENCLGHALVQFADLRYTEPGTARGNFSVNIPVDCPAP